MSLADTRFPQYVRGKDPTLASRTDLGDAFIEFPENAREPESGVGLPRDSAGDVHRVIQRV
jgi:hypothetical protein